MKIFTDSSFPLKKNSRQVTAKWNLTEVTNMRPDHDFPELWRPIGRPRALSSQQMIPVFIFRPEHSSSENVTFWTKGARLYCSRTAGNDIFAAPKTLLGELPAEPVKFIPLPHGAVKLLLRHHRPVYIAYDADLNFAYAGTPPPLPEVGIGITDVRSLRRQVPGGKLSGLSNGKVAGTLAPADAAMLSERALQAYNELKTEARAAGRFIQPVLARWRILDAGGDTIMQGPWVFPSAQLGMQCTGGISFSSSDLLASVSHGVVQAQSYLLALRGTLPEWNASWAAIAHRLVVEVSDYVEPVDDGAAAPTGYVDIGTEGSAAARVYLPGCSAAAAADPAVFVPRFKDTLLEAAAHSRIVASIPFPCSGAAAVPGYITAHQAAVCSVTDASLPRYAYSVACEVAAQMFLANPLRLGSPAIPAKCFEIANGLFSPLVAVYTTAFSEISCGGTRLSLTPLVTEALAYHIHPALQPFANAPVVTEAPDAAVPRYGVIHAFPKGFGASPPVVSAPLSTEIVAIHQAPRAGSAWDFARVKLLLFGPGGIRLATFAEGGAIRAVAPLDPRPVRTAQAVAPGCSESGGAAVFAIAGGDLLKISPSRTDTLLKRCDASAIAWAQRYDEIWMLLHDRLQRLSRDNIRINILDDNFAGPSSVSFHSLDNGLALIASDAGVFSLNEEVVPELTRCRLELLAAVAGTPRRAVLDLAASEVTGSVAILGDNGSEIPEQLAAFGIRGPVNAPLELPLRVPFRRRITLRADLRLPPDACVSLPDVKSYPQG